MMYWIILGVFGIVGALVSSRLKSKFNQYSAVGLRSGKSGAEIAYDMLRHYGIHDVKIVEGQGFLSDHYNPMTKTVALSPEVYRARSIAAAAVAAHECGHAVQHNTAYSMLMMRSRLVPIVQISSQLQQFLFMGAIFGGFLGGGGALGYYFMLALVITFGVTALFSLVTLPVEFDASNRALVWLDQTGAAQGREYEGAKDALWWAAMTYVVSALSALTLFLYFLLSFLNRE